MEKHWLLLLIVPYTVSVVAMYIYVCESHSKGGIHQHANADWSDFFFMICPVVNTFIAVIAYIAHPPYPRKSKYTWNTFFMVSKK